MLNSEGKWILCRYMKTRIYMIDSGSENQFISKSERPWHKDRYSFVRPQVGPNNYFLGKIIKGQM